MSRHVASRHSAALGAPSSDVARAGDLTYALAFRLGLGLLLSSLGKLPRFMQSRVPPPDAASSVTPRLGERLGLRSAAGLVRCGAAGGDAALQLLHLPAAGAAIGLDMHRLTVHMPRHKAEQRRRRKSRRDDDGREAGRGCSRRGSCGERVACRQLRATRRARRVRVRSGGAARGRRCPPPMQRLQDALSRLSVGELHVQHVLA